MVRVVLQFFTTRDGEIHILISKNEISGETITSGGIQKEKAVRVIDTFEINESLVNRLNLYTFPSIDAIREKVVDFSQLEALREIIVWQLKAGEMDRKQFKTLEHIDDIGSGNKDKERKNSRHRIGSENKNTVKTIGEKTSSQYEETSMNDSYYQK